MRTLFTSESVTEGHPDKICDQISDGILDALLAIDPNSRCACETTAEPGAVHIMGEITTAATVNYIEIARRIIREIGYTKPEYGFDADTCEISCSLHTQSADIAQGVDMALEAKEAIDTDGLGAGDQGMMFGFACDETPERMPLPITLAHRITRRLAAVRKNGELSYLRPDGKAQVTVEYENGKPVRVNTVVLSTQHDEDADPLTLRRDMIERVIKPCIPTEMLDDETKYYINPTGRFVLGDNATLLHSHLEINRSLLYIIASELKKSGGKISLLIQPDYTFLMNILTAGGYASSSVDIDHIICLNNNQNVSFARQNYNLNCLRNILPLYSNHYQYNCYYYYDDIDAVTSAFALFPYAVITTEYACLISSDMQSGFITKDPESLKLFSYLFSQYLAQTTPLLRPVTDLGGQIQYVENTMQNITEGYFFQMLPCLTRFLTRDMLETYIVKDLPHRSELLDRLQNYLHELQSIPASADLTFICSIEGIRKFLNTGRVGEYPAYAYTPLNLSDRLFLIRQLANSMLNEHNRLLKRAIGMIDHEFYLFAGRQYGYFMFQTSNTDRMIYLNIEEPGLLFTFFDFCDTLDDEIFFTSEEAYRKIHDLIQEYSK